jgi:hypothetical protein
VAKTALQIDPQATDIETDVETAIALCGGDMRAALRATLIANAYLDAEVERLLELVSPGYSRGKVRMPAQNGRTKVRPGH